MKSPGPSTGLSHSGQIPELSVWSSDTTPELGRRCPSCNCRNGGQVTVYSLNEIATEKIVALSDPARTEPRDLYDLWFLTVEAGVDLSRLVEAIAEKLRFRKKDIAGLEDRILKKEQRLNALWIGRLAHQIEALPEFDAVFRAVRREVRQAGFAG